MLLAPAGFNIHMTIWILSPSCEFPRVNPGGLICRPDKFKVFYQPSPIPNSIVPIWPQLLDKTGNPILYFTRFAPNSMRVGTPNLSFTAGAAATVVPTVATLPPGANRALMVRSWEFPRRIFEIAPMIRLPTMQSGICAMQGP